MKADIHPEYVLSTVHCSCGNSFVTRSTKPELHVEICAQCHPFYTGKQKLVDTGGRVERFQRRLEKAGKAARPTRLGRTRDDRLLDMSQAIGGQAVLEGVMMRGPRNWAVAVRKPDGNIAYVWRSIDPLMARHWALRLPVVRGVVALGESLAIGFRALSVSANYAAQEEAEGDEEPAEIGRWALFFSFAVAIGFALTIFKVGPALLTDTLPISDGRLFVVVEGLVRVTVFVLYLFLLSLIPSLQARVPVPRRRAQGDQRLRGRRGAHARDRAALLADPPALRHRVPALGDGDRRLRVRVLRAGCPGTG